MMVWRGSDGPVRPKDTGTTTAVGVPPTTSRSLGVRTLAQFGVGSMRFAVLGVVLFLPVFAAPLFLVSSPELVLAACKAGIIGSFPALKIKCGGPEDLATLEAVRAEFATLDIAVARVDVVGHAPGQAARRVHDHAEVQVSELVGHAAHGGQRGRQRQFLRQPAKWHCGQSVVIDQDKQWHSNPQWQ